MLTSWNTGWLLEHREIITLFKFHFENENGEPPQDYLTYEAKTIGTQLF